MNAVPQQFRKITFGTKVVILSWIHQLPLWEIKIRNTLFPTRDIRFGVYLTFFDNRQLHPSFNFFYFWLLLPIKTLWKFIINVFRFKQIWNSFISLIQNIIIIIISKSAIIIIYPYLRNLVIQEIRIQVSSSFILYYHKLIWYTVR